MEDIKQEYRVQITMYAGHKISLGDDTYVELKFNYKDVYMLLWELDIIVGNQKTLSSTKPTHAIVKCRLPIEETGKVNLGDKFSIIDHDYPKKIGKGHIIEIVKQE